MTGDGKDQFDIMGIDLLMLGDADRPDEATPTQPLAEDRRQAVACVSQHCAKPDKGPFEVRGDVDTLMAELRALDDGDVWMVGGGQLRITFIERGALDEIEIYLIPEMLGDGHRLFPTTGFRASPTLISAQTLDQGCVRLHYRF